MVTPRCDGCRCWLADDEARQRGECHKNAPRPELAVLQVQLGMVIQENADLRKALQEAEATLRDLRRVIVDTEVSEGDGP
jgi:uncharacterized membrane protein